jgi:hypothetical protein
MQSVGQATRAIEDQQQTDDHRQRRRQARRDIARSKERIEGPHQHVIRGRQRVDAIASALQIAVRLGKRAMCNVNSSSNQKTR